ncbi:helix-turn-helix transcriptional regulator [Fusibacter ferrireducens]|uniref:YafY family transcriptional regulator n=1 Tax=Fusibacter ferrireducens TaxID=2785058 RepID=A0ABR9ZP43_9FIRM|nr:YafY family protein [Fusibacter ferrireducens]MBF4692240.1 YafY family transcriptional regulator [Fusibacter ferrireducens]
MSKMGRLIDMWLYINRKKIFTAQELADEFNVSLRTIQRDLLELTEMGVPFYSEVGRNGGYTMLHGEMLPPISFTEEETASIIFTYESLKQYQDIPYEAEIDSVINKLISQVSKPLQEKLSSIQKYISMKIPYRVEKSPFLKSIFRAAIAKQIIFFSYDSLESKKDKKAIPLGIYSENGYWYFPAYDLNHERINLFRVDRVFSLKVGNAGSVKLPTMAQWMEQRDTILPEDSCQLVLRISQKAVRDFSNSFFDFSKIVWNSKNTGILYQRVSKRELSYIASLIATFGSDAEIIEPQDLKDMLIKKMEDTLSLYRDN